MVNMEAGWRPKDSNELLGKLFDQDPDFHKKLLKGEQLEPREIYIKW